MTFRGTVDQIQPASAFKCGDVTFTVTVTLDTSTVEAHAADLRWGMAVMDLKMPRMNGIHAGKVLLCENAVD